VINIYDRFEFEYENWRTTPGFRVYAALCPEWQWRKI